MNTRDETTVPPAGKESHSPHRSTTSSTSGKAKPSQRRTRKSAVRKAASQKVARKRGPGKRYTKAEKAKILAAAAKGNMTGEQVAKQFGISTLSFYRWRGPVRKDAVARMGKRGPGRPKRSGKIEVDLQAIRRAVQVKIRKLLPRIVREEVALLVKGL